MNLSTFKNGAKAGFTLVELLVVILIIVILSVTMLPLLKPFVTKAQYAAEGVPVIGNLRTKVELYRIEKDHLPGIPLDTQGKPITNAPAGMPGLGSVTIVADDSAIRANVTSIGIQSMQGVCANHTNTGAYAWWDASGLTPGDTDVLNAPDSQNLHVFKKIDVNYADLTGKRLRPYHFQYAVPYCNGENYCWVIGTFGDGGTLPKGTGYAVLEFNNVLAKAKFVATFERYKAEGNAGQLRLYITDGAYAITEGDRVTIPSISPIVNATGASDAQIKIQEFKTALGAAGWDVQ